MHTGAKLVQNQKGSPVTVSVARTESSAAIPESSCGNTESSPSGSQWSLPDMYSQSVLLIAGLLRYDGLVVNVEVKHNFETSSDTICVTICHLKVIVKE